MPGLSKDANIAIISSVTVFVVSSVLFFILGFVCGQLYKKQKHSVETVPPLDSPDPMATTLTPLYEDIQPKRNEEELELKTNVAYGPVNRK